MKNAARYLLRHHTFKKVASVNPRMRKRHDDPACWVAAVQQVKAGTP